MRLSIRCAFLLAIFGVVSIEAASQRPIFGRPSHVPEKGFTVFGEGLGLDAQIAIPLNC